MTKAQIKAELRRSALYDRSPYGDVAAKCFNVACDMKDDHARQSIAVFNDEELRTFFLLVAEAL